MNTVYYEQKSVKLSCYNKENLTEIPHFHSELEMIVCFSGKVNCFLSGQNFGMTVLGYPQSECRINPGEKFDFTVKIQRRK